MNEMTEVEEIQSEIEIAKHNLWVAKTHVQDRQEELSKLENKLEKLKPTPKFVDNGCACADPNGHCDCYGA